MHWFKVNAEERGRSKYKDRRNRNNRIWRHQPGKSVKILLASNKKASRGRKQELFLAIKEQNWVVGRQEAVGGCEEGGSEEGRALGPGQQRLRAAPRVLDKKLEKRKKRVRDDIASSWGAG